MNFVPGEFVRRAAANVTSTVSSTVSGAVSTVTQAASGKKRHDSVIGDNMLHHAKEKCNMVIKSTPSKDAATTANLSIKSGFLMKRNEQGNWQKRFVCIVPHLFLYYFDSELADSPRGVIDLELYTQVFRDDSLRLSTEDEEVMRSYYFDDEDKDNLNDWSTSLTRDRYHTVCEERNAYQQMQHEMTGVIDELSKKFKQSTQEREILKQQLQHSEQFAMSAKNVLQSVLIELGITDEEAVNLEEVNRVGVILKQRIVDLRHSFDSRLDQLLEEVKLEQSDREKLSEELHKTIEHEQVARRNLELLITKERMETEQKLKDAQGQNDNLTMNFQVAVAGKSAADAKNATLNDQKKLLVKEVKQLRKKVDDANASTEELKSMNDRLVKAAQALQIKLKAALASAAAAHSVSVSSDVVSDSNIDTESQNVTSDSEAQAAAETAEPLLDSLPGDEEIDQLLRRSGEFSASLAADSQSDQDGNSGPATGDDANHSSLHGKQSFHSLFDEHSLAEDEERMSWEMPNAQLRELGWLSDEQSRLLDKRLLDEQQQHLQRSQHNSRSGSPHPLVASAFKQSEDSLRDLETASTGSSSSSSATHSNPSKRSSLSLFASVLGSHDGSESSSTPTAPVEQRRSSMSMFSSMFNSSNKSSAPKDSPASPLKDTYPEIPKPNFAQKNPMGAKAFFAAPHEEEEDHTDRLAPAMRLQCLRCKGTVEGPKYSTCKCSVPALTVDDLHQSTGTLGMISGIFSKSSSAAGELAGGIMKATAQSVSGLVNSNSSGNSASHTSGSNSLLSEPLAALPGSPSQHIDEAVL